MIKLKLGGLSRGLNGEGRRREPPLGGGGFAVAYPAREMFLNFNSLKHVFLHLGDRFTSSFTIKYYYKLIAWLEGD
jgi:hypothetical protein